MNSESKLPHPQAPVQLALQEGLRARTSKRRSRKSAGEEEAGQEVDKDGADEPSGSHPRQPDGRKCKLCPHKDDQENPAMVKLNIAGSLMPWEVDSQLDRFHSLFLALDCSCRQGNLYPR